MRKRDLVPQIAGVVIEKNFWKEKGLDEDELHIVDGSGLFTIE